MMSLWRIGRGVRGQISGASPAPLGACHDYVALHSFQLKGDLDQAKALCVACCSMTLERISVDGWMPPWTKHQHISRYRWVASKVHGMRVVDAACGSGYGSDLMIKGGATSVEAFDIDLVSVERAQQNYKHANLSFNQGDVCALPLADKSCDAFVSLETIEHLEQDESFLNEVVRVLKAGGLFICSTPNRELTNAGTTIVSKPFNPFHVREYSEAEFEGLLRKHFSSVSLFGQTSFSSPYAWFLGRVGRIFPALAVKIHQVRKLVTCMWDSDAKHAPRELRRGERAEILVAYCRL
jgi:SAM-dependent methyltransferase